MPRRILFVCSGNTCRSPMAAAILRAALPTDSEWIVESAGLSTSPGLVASHNAIAALKENGINLSAHRSRRATREILRRADIVVPMTQSHRMQAIAIEPSVEAKSFLLLSFLPQPPRNRDLQDPVGGNLPAYRACRDTIAECIPTLLDYLLD